jgi:uncharacterized protein (DUF302 family)
MRTFHSGHQNNRSIALRAVVEGKRHARCAPLARLRQNRGVIVTESSSGYASTVTALITAIEQRGLTVFARVDHAGGARAAGLELAGEELIVFGNPLGGTPLMQSDPRIGIELPLKMLVWSDGEQALLGYRDPRELLDIYDVAERAPILEQMAKLLGELADEAAGASPA